MEKIIFECPVCGHKTDLTGKVDYSNVHHKCEKCEYLFTVQWDCNHKKVFMPKRRTNLKNKLICPHCDDEIRYDAGIEQYSEDFDYECCIFNEDYKIECPSCEKPFIFSIDRIVVYIDIKTDVEDYAEWWEIKEGKEES